MLTDLLARTSRTFALAIPCLPDPVRYEVTVAYLLFRIADTIEDGPHLNRDEKLSALAELDRRLLEQPGSSSGLTLTRMPCDNADYLQLLGSFPLVLDQLPSFAPAVQATIISHVCESVGGMRQFIAEGSPAGRIEIRCQASLRQYCYAVAGIVGEMLTELFVHAVPRLEQVRPTLSRHARFFGEGLQLVNILKDSRDDQQMGHRFEPGDTSQVQLFELARDGLTRAAEYVDALRTAKAPAGIMAFTQLPLQLAWRTLEYVQRTGPGSKVPRGEVMQILAETLAANGLTTGIPLSAQQRNLFSAR